jgi:hypothetical protein
MTTRQALVELVTGLDHHLLVNYGTDIITDVLFRHHVNHAVPVLAMPPFIRPVNTTFFGNAGVPQAQAAAAPPEEANGGVDNIMGDDAPDTPHEIANLLNLMRYATQHHEIAD